MTKRAYRIESKSRGCAEFEPSHLIYTDTIYSDGRIESTVTGYCDGETVNSKRVRQAEGLIDFERIHRSRVAQGWREVAS